MATETDGDIRLAAADMFIKAAAAAAANEKGENEKGPQAGGITKTGIAAPRRNIRISARHHRRGNARYISSAVNGSGRRKA